MPKPRAGRAGRGGSSGGHAKTSSSSSSRAGPGSSGGRKTGPGSGPGDRTAAKDASAVAQAHQQRAFSPARQQRLLDVFARALGPALASPQLSAVLQAVKSALFARDFAAAFDAESSSSSSSSGAPPPLDAYAARWSPTRALCYAAVLDSPLLREHWRQPVRRMVAIGGGAAEAVAFGALFTETEAQGDLVLVDQAPWDSVVQRLHTAMENGLVAPSRFTVDVRQLDILQVGDQDMQPLLAGSPLITLFFTLNELFTAGGIGAAATFLLRLTAAAAPGSLLLVVDSPGSYAETTVGTQARRYPMRWLLDKILLEDAPAVDGGDNKNPAWTRLHQDDAIWFRLPPGLAYPIRLEDMRYQIHLYKREGPDEER